MELIRVIRIWTCAAYLAVKSRQRCYGEFDGFAVLAFVKFMLSDLAYRNLSYATRRNPLDAPVT